MITEQEFETAKEAAEMQRQHAHATAARYDRKSERLIVSLHNGIELAVPVELVEGLAGRDADSLSRIEITPSGLGLHWPAIDADVQVGALLGGVFGSPSWMAKQLGASGGRNASPAKSAAARLNGQRGGRPRKRG
jgi:hypothetical protein